MSRSQMCAAPSVLVKRRTRFQLLPVVLLLLFVVASFPSPVVSQYVSSTGIEGFEVCEEHICYPESASNLLLTVIFDLLVSAAVDNNALSLLYEFIALALEAEIQPGTDFASLLVFQACTDTCFLQNYDPRGRRLLQTDEPFSVTISVSFNDNALDSTGVSAVALATAFQSILAREDASLLLLPSDSVFVSIPTQNVTIESSEFVVTPSDVHTGSLCFLSYSLPGNVDYPWSVATSVSFEYDDIPFITAEGTALVLFNGSGTRTFTNRFGVSFSTPLTMDTAHGNLLYVNSTSPVDRFGLQWNLSLPVQLPGAGPLAVTSVINVLNASGVVVEAGASRFDSLGQAFLSSVPGFNNILIGASNENALAANYTACKAPINFINGMRQPTEPSASNGAVRFSYWYFISDGATYTVSTNLTITTSSAFATTVDQLGNPYQTVVSITGIRRYTYLPTGAQIVSQVTGLSSGIFPQPDQRFFPYSFIASSPGVYTENTVPFLDNDGLGFALTPSVPANGIAPGVGTQYSATSVFVSATNISGLTEARSSRQPLLTLQQQSYSLLA